MKSADFNAVVLGLDPLPVAVFLLLWPAFGVSLAVATRAITLALTFSELEEAP